MPSRLLEEWKGVALQGDPAALRTWTLSRAGELAAACGTRPEVFGFAVNCAGDDVLCRLVSEQSDFSIAKLNACSVKPRARRKKTHA